MYIGSSEIQLNKRRRNPEIRLGPEFLKTAKNEYENWKEKWWREVVQNSVDSGATKIICKTEIIESDEGRIHKVSCEDNGSGMDSETLFNKFLVLGESTKKTESGSTGGFGKAKELIILPWLKWEIRTRNILVSGSGTGYDVFVDQPYLDGVKVTVFMGDSYNDHTTELAAKSFIKKCNIPHVRFTVNDEVVVADLEGELVKESENFNIYYNKDFDEYPEGYIFVRTNGMYTFYTRIYGLKLKGQIIVELKKPSIDILHANRDGFRVTKIKNEYEAFVSTLAKDVRSGLRGGNMMRKIYRRGKKFKSYEAFNFSDQLSEDLARDGIRKIKSRDRDNGKSVLSDDQVQEVLNQIDERMRRREELMDHENENHGIGSGLKHSSPIAGSLIQNVTFKDKEELSNIVRQLMWEPDFFILNEIENYKIPEQFKPENMGNKIRKLVRLWAEFCRFVLIQLGSGETFGTGFVFSYNEYRGSFASAMFVEEEGEQWLLINPFRGGKPENGLLNISDEHDIDYLYARAIHEVTHLADDIIYHDEDFASAFTDNVEKTLRGRKNLRYIKKAVSDFFKNKIGPKKKIRKISKAEEKPNSPRRSFYKVKKIGVRGRSAYAQRLKDILEFSSSPEGLEFRLAVTPCTWPRNHDRPRVHDSLMFYVEKGRTLKVFEEGFTHPIEPESLIGELVGHFEFENVLNREKSHPPYVYDEGYPFVEEEELDL